MTTTAGRRLSPEQVQQIRTVVATAEQMGCQLQPSPARPSIIKGLCPFHQVAANGDRNSLEVNTDTGRFHCAACGAQGNPMAFMALIWGVSAQDAHILYEANPDALSQRPPYPTTHIQAENGRPRPQNTALLSKAAAHYSGQLRYHYEPQNFLALLGVNLRKAEAIGLGYCPGGTLQEALADDEVPPQLSTEEIADTDLLHPVTGHEIMTGRITIADQDYLGACLWLTSFRPETEAYEEHRWPQDRPATYGIPGVRQYLLNAYAIDRQKGDAILTDDVRLYILLAAEGLPAVLLTQRRRPETEPRQIADRAVAALKRRSIKRLSIVSHDVTLRELIRKALLPEMDEANIKSFNKSQLLQALDRPGRNLAQFVDFANETENGGGRNETGSPAAGRRRPAAAAAEHGQQESPAAPDAAAAGPEDNEAPAPPAETTETPAAAAAPTGGRARAARPAPEPAAEPKDNGPDPARPETANPDAAQTEAPDPDTAEAETLETVEIPTAVVAADPMAADADPAPAGEPEPAA